MSVVKVNKLNKTYGPNTILSKISFELDRGQKVALVGPNGTGKTTLLKILAGLEEADNGQIEFAKGARVGYLPQDFQLVGKESVAGYFEKETGLPATDHRVAIMLAGFGLEDLDLERRLSELSSGQKSKIILITILLKGADLLLLDEPTNNLDLPALIWLEDYLERSEAAAIIVSHDRRFLDKVVRKIFELDWLKRGLKINGGTYSAYLEMELKRLRRRKFEYEQQQEEIARLRNLAANKRTEAAAGARWQGTDNDKLLRGFKRDRAKSSMRTARVVEKKIDRMAKLENPEEREPLRLALAPNTEGGVLDLSTANLVAGYQDGFHVGPVSLDVRYGKRAGFLGLNGSGKSTLLKTITGELAPLSGSVSLGSGIKIGNMMQEHETLPREATLLEFMKSKTELRNEDIFNLLQKFSLTSEQIKQPIGVLSPGGRARLLLALFASEGVNTLVLDEPTNHLDLEALDALLETLKTYTGTVLLVSHDRYFIEEAKLDYVYVLAEGKVSEIPDYRDYVAEAESRAKKLLRLLK